MGKKAEALLDMVQRKRHRKILTEIILDAVNYALISFGKINSLI